MGGGWGGGEQGVARWGLLGFIGMDLLGWLGRSSLLDGVSMLLRRFCWVRFAWFCLAS